jgi:hypothetical protein
MHLALWADSDPILSADSGPSVDEAEGKANSLLPETRDDRLSMHTQANQQHKGLFPSAFEPVSRPIAVQNRHKPGGRLWPPTVPGHPVRPTDPVTSAMQVIPATPLPTWNRSSEDSPGRKLEDNTSVLQMGSVVFSQRVLLLRSGSTTSSFCAQPTCDRAAVRFEKEQLPKLRNIGNNSNGILAGNLVGMSFRIRAVESLKVATCFNASSVTQLVGSLFVCAQQLLFAFGRTRRILGGRVSPRILSWMQLYNS